MPPPRARLAIALAALGSCLVLALLLPRAAGAALRERWRSPVDGVLVGRFAYARREPFAAGARRGIDLAAAPGAAVRSACRGAVTFAGPVPGGRGLGVTVRCGGLVATHLGLGRLAVRRGARVAAGTRLGAVGPAGRVRLGARRAGDRFGYVDPLGLLRGSRSPPPAPAVPAPVRPRRSLPRALPLGPVPAAAPARARVRVPAARRAPIASRQRPVAGFRPGAAIPAGAWAGLVLLAAGVPLGGLVRRGRRRARSGVASAMRHRPGVRRL